MQTLIPGTEVGGFVIEEAIGGGLLGPLYRATDTALNRPVVVKEFAPIYLMKRAQNGLAVVAEVERDREEARAIAYFRTEFEKAARALMTVHHPNIAEVLTLFEANGTVCAARPYYEGMGLDAILERDGAITGNEALEFAVPVLSAIKAAHAEEIYGLCSEPADIFITFNGFPMVVGMGTLTMELRRYLVGNLDMPPQPVPYEPPENLFKEERYRPASEVYSVAAILHTALAGDPPPEASVRLAALSRNGSDPLLSARLAGNVTAKDEALLNAISAGLEIDSKIRTQTAAEMLTLMQASETGSETGTVDNETLAEFRRAVERNDAQTAVAAIGRQSRVVSGAYREMEQRWAIEVASYPPGQRSGTQRIRSLEHIKAAYDDFVDRVSGIDGVQELIAPAIDDSSAIEAHPLLALILMRDPKYWPTVARRAVEIWEASVPEPKTREGGFGFLARLFGRSALRKTYRPGDWHRYFPRLLASEAEKCGDNNLAEIGQRLSGKLEKLETEDRRQDILPETERWF